MVAINSIDGRDVLSGIFYAGVKGYPVRFMASPGGNSEIFAAKVGSGQSVLLIQSSSNPVSGFVESELRAKNNQIELFPSADGGATNLALAARSGAGTFIIVDSAYSDSAISVLPYAQALRAYVIFADAGNIDKIKETVGGKNVIIYGYVDSKVSSELSSLSPQKIGKGEDKYEDNVELVGMIVNKYSPDRLIITDGASIEDGMVGTIPILLSGRIVPQVTYDFLKQEVRDGKVSGVLLIGGDLINPVYDMRERMKTDFAKEGISKSMGVLVKFAQALPATQSGTLALDVFLLPAYKPQLNITEIFYDKANKKVMVGLENTGEGPLYYNLEVKVKANDADFKIFGQSETQLIERGQSVGLEYPLDLSSVQEGAISATAVAKFGSSKKSLEEFQTSSGALASITYTDNTNVTIKYAKYENDKQRVAIAIKNNGPDTAYVFSRITLMAEDGTPTKVSGASIRQIDPYSIFMEEFPLQLTDAELSLNKEVSVSIDYGGRRGFLGKKANYSIPLEREGLASGQMSLAAAGIAVIAIALLAAAALAVYLLFFRKKK
jgi:hypothetical protein